MQREWSNSLGVGTGQGQERMGSKASGCGPGLQEMTFCLCGLRAGWREVQKEPPGCLAGKAGRIWF